MPNRRTGTGLSEVGRPTALTEQLQSVIINLVERGNYHMVAAQAVGIAPQTISMWLKWGREDMRDGNAESPYAKFAVAIARADAEGEVRDLEQLRIAGRTDWRAVAWKMERRYPDRWLLKQTVTVSEAGLVGGIDAQVVNAPEMVPLVTQLVRKLADQVKLTEGSERR